MPLLVLAFTDADIDKAIVYGIVAVLCWPLWAMVHIGIQRCCVAHVRRYCKKEGINVLRWNIQLHFDESGIKTEFLDIGLDCVNNQNEHRLICLLVWPFGVHNVLTDEKWAE